MNVCEAFKNCGNNKVEPKIVPSGRPDGSFYSRCLLLRSELKLSWETLADVQLWLLGLHSLHSLAQSSRLLVPLICLWAQSHVQSAVEKWVCRLQWGRRARGGGLMSTVSYVYPVSQLLDHNLWLISRESFWMKCSVSCRGRCRLNPSEPFPGACIRRALVYYQSYWSRCYRALVRSCWKKKQTPLLRVLK